MNIEALRQGRDMTAKVVVTSFHPGPHGGGIVIGTDERGNSKRATISALNLPRRPVQGEVWRFTGTEAFSHEHASTYIEAAVALPMPLEGEAIVRYLADNPAFAGVGYRTALRLRNGLGLEGLYEAFRRRDHGVIATVVGPELAAVIVNAIDLLGDEVGTLQALERAGIDGATAGLAFSVWGTAAPKYLESEPYALRLLLPWRTVDERALRMGVLPGDERRQFALVEEALARILRRGHTAATRAVVCRTYQELAKTSSPVATVAAVQRAIDAGRCVVHDTGLIQSRGVSWMEREVERLLLERLEPHAEIEAGQIADDAIQRTEAALKKRLTPRQREAAAMAVNSRVSALAGGAGTGKTTALHAIAQARLAISTPHAQPSDRVVQAAVAGRAARRIAQATGLPAVTLARLIRDLENDDRDLRGSLLVIDESSMLDLLQAYQLLTKLPTDCDVLFVGDPAQLPPIGPGQIFSSVLAGQRIPRVELDLVQRQAGDSAIPAIAYAIRNGRMPDLPHFDPARPDREGVFLMSTTPSRQAIAESALSAFSAMSGPVPARGHAKTLHDRDVQVLCATKNGDAGTKALNRSIEDTYMSRQILAPWWGLSVGSKVLWLKNDYQKAPVRHDDGSIKTNPRTGLPEYRGLMNGCLGILRRHSDGHDTDRGLPASWIEFEDGTSDWIYESDLQNLTNGWAITVHKAQGSAFERVVAPIAECRLVDRSLIYTAVTRAVRTCVLVGDPHFIAGAVEAPPRVQDRQTCLSL